MILYRAEVQYYTKAAHTENRPTGFCGNGDASTGAGCSLTRGLGYRSRFWAYGSRWRRPSSLPSFFTAVGRQESARRDFRRLHPVNSIAALAGHFTATHNLPPGLTLFAFSALAGGAIRSHMGSVHLSNLAIYRILGAILLSQG